MRVLFITNLWPDEDRPSRGPFVKRQADSLEAAGASVDAMVIKGYRGRAEYLRAGGRVARLNRSCPYDIVHAHYGHSIPLARMQFRVPLVATYWGSDLLGKRGPSGEVEPISRIEAVALRQFSRLAAATMTQSLEMERRLPPSRRARNQVVAAGIDLERFIPMPRTEARERLGWDLDEKVVLFAGNPELPVKNHPLAQSCMRIVEERIPAARLRVAWGVAPDEIPIWMNAADALLLPSLSEGSPNVVKEAMATELPVVATPVGDVPELLEGVEGCHVCPPEAGRLADAVVDALGRGRLPGAREAVVPLGVAAVAERILGIYEEVLRARAARRPSHSRHRPGS